MPISPRSADARGVTHTTMHPGSAAPVDETADRERIARERAAGRHDAPLTRPELLARVAAAVERADQVADVGTAVPPFAALGTLRRAFAYATGRLLLYFLRLITVDQAQFNRLLRGATADLQRIAAGLDDDLAALHTAAAAAHAASAAHDARLAAQERAGADSAAQLEEMARALAEQRRTLEDVRETAAYLRRRLADRDRRMDALLARSGDTPAVAAGDGEVVAPPPAAADTMVAPSIDDTGFRETFRGDEATLREWLRRYVPKFAGRTEVLDVGCGRGEFLELLREAGVTAHGVDLSADAVLCCREKGLDVVHADAFSHLAALPDESLGGIFCAQVIEHLPAAAAVRLVRLAYAKLRRGGVLLIETLNPECLLVHYRWFWMDLTHVRLIHPETLKFLFVTNGFRDLEGQYAPAREETPRLPALALRDEDPALRDAFNAATAYVNTVLHGSPDYALIGYR
jgi:SAM-dependent methyltransferase